jgi:magnesium transporter
VTVGLLLGLCIGAAGFVRVTLFGEEARVAIVLALTLPLVVIWSVTVATLIPFFAARFKIDPAVVSAPMITTIVDTTGLMIYFGLAALILIP